MRSTRVFGPAYLDIVLRVNEPILDVGTLDGSYSGTSLPDQGSWTIQDESGGEIVIRASSDSHSQAIRVNGSLVAGKSPWKRELTGRNDGCHLGGMGAGFAKAMGGTLVSALGTRRGAIDGTGRFIIESLNRESIPHQPILIEGQATDWTLIVTSGGHGDKLAVGFRGCHASIHEFDPELLAERCDILVVAGLPNRLTTQALTVPANVRFLAPALRNMQDQDPPLAALAGYFDVMSCNRREWNVVKAREVILQNTPIVAITDGPDGCTIFFTQEDGQRVTHSCPAFPREAPTRDTNRAGEAFASTLISSLLNFGWTPGPCDLATIERATLRASAAAALVLDREDFGFPSDAQVDEALAFGAVRRGESPGPR